MRVKPLTKSLIACGVLSIAFVVSADVTLTDRDGSKTLSSDKFYKYPLKIDNNTITNTIIEIDSEIITTIDASRKQYFQITIKEACALQTQAFSYIKGLTKEESPKVIEMKKGKKNINIAGYSTTQYKVYEDGDLVNTVWLSSDKKLVKEFRPIKVIEEKINCLADKLGYEINDSDKALWDSSVELKSYSGDITEEDAEEYYADLKSGTYNSDDYDSDDEIDAVEIVKVDFSDININEFKIPKNYKKVTQQAFYTALNQENIDEFNAAVAGFNENSDEFNNAVEEAYAEYQETDEVEEISKKQKAIDKLKEVAEEKGGAVGKLLGKLF